MTHQEFNNIYYSYTKDKKGIRPYQVVRLTGEELKEFVEYALDKARQEGSFYKNQIRLFS